MKLEIGLLMLLLSAQPIPAQDSQEQEDTQFLMDAHKAIKLDPGEINALVTDSTFQLVCGKVVAWTGLVLSRPLDPKHPAKREHILFTVGHGIDACMQTGGTP